MGEERSAAGDPVYRHEVSVSGEISAGDPVLIAAVEDHLAKYVGEPATAVHELISPYVHVDVHVVAPRPDRPVFTLVTSGMSERPMVADGRERYAELTMLLPPTWPAPDTPEFETPSARWPYTLLQDLARLPHEFATMLWTGHTVPNGDPPEPYAADTALCGALLAPPVIAPEGFERLTVGDREIHLLAVMLLHADEMALKLEKGTNALLDLLDAAELTEVLEIDRPSVVRRRRRLFRR